MAPITKELFIETINLIEKQVTIDWKNSDMLSEVFHSFVEPYDNSLLLNQLLKILNYSFGIDKEKCKYGTDIDYFIWELDFGKKYVKGGYTIDDEDIPLATAEDLWNLLNRKNKISEKIICCDIDNTICTTIGNDYANSQSIPENIAKINKLYDEGNNITYWTARGRKSGIDWSQITKKQLNDWGCLYHNLIMGKLSYDLFIDDRTKRIEEI